MPVSRVLDEKGVGGVLKIGIGRDPRDSVRRVYVGGREKRLLRQAMALSAIDTGEGVKTGLKRQKRVLPITRQAGSEARRDRGVVFRHASDNAASGKHDADRYRQ